MGQILVDIYFIGGQVSKYEDAALALSKIKDTDSAIFKINEKFDLDLPNLEDSTQDYFSDACLRDALASIHFNSHNLNLCFIEYPLEGKYYYRSLGDGLSVATFSKCIEEYRNSHVDLRIYILLYIYAACVLYKRAENDSTFTVDNICNSFHMQTRGCIFDNWNTVDEIFKVAEEPKLCSICTEKYKSYLPEGFLETLNTELKMHCKVSLYYKIYRWVNAHRLESIIISFLTSIVASIIASVIYNAFHK